MRSLIIALFLVFSVSTAGAVMRKGDMQVALFACKDEGALRMLKEEDKISDKRALAMLMYLVNERRCGVFTSPKYVLLEKLIETYNDSDGLLTEMWTILDPNGREWYTIGADPRQPSSI